MKGHVTPFLRKKLQSFASQLVKSLLTVEIVVLLIWRSGLASNVQLPVASVTAATRTNLRRVK
jgi:hypothetical protein